MFLITAYPRSGTRYMSELLQSVNINALHETPGDDGCVSWLHAGTGLWMEDLPVIKKENFNLIVHQVRNTLHVISSAMTIGDYSLNYMLDNIAGGHTLNDFSDKLEAVMFTYLKWNLLIEAKAVLRVRLEWIEKEFDVLMKVLGFSDRCYKPIPENINSRKDKYTDLEWSDLYNCNGELASKVYGKYIEYGYA